MKYLLTTLLITGLSCSCYSQTSRWKTLFYSDDGKKQTCVDTISPVRVEFFDGHSNVILIWLRENSMPTREGEYVQVEDQRMAVDINKQQYEFKSRVIKYNKVIISNKDYDLPEWSNIVPDTFGELILNYCKYYVSLTKNK
ncbi:hypothetical protein BDD43_3690 [Mucilaginibacter gracilis]|uniref:Uncharacterized protein n=1 Tax=Mucilaginibacter gracilis TaxID=423350 RepID=A0A495J468_9SPHI|nr:hypothetical protein [Mucilaginibacter gracilis]RKR83481.1 hypothetical protein BDD43_3690 [Mucilaginibacter gracilis]